MKDVNAQPLLSKVMGWTTGPSYEKLVPDLLLLSDYKYDQYQRFAPGQRFIESLALWLQQFEAGDRDVALRFVADKLVFISEAEFSHLVQTAYPDVIEPERLRLIAEEKGIAPHRVLSISRESRFVELGLKSLYLGLSDGSRTNEARRASRGEIGNEQIWQAYELGDEKAEDMAKSLAKALKTKGFDASAPRFNLIWLLDDFAGSGNTYIRFDHDEQKYKGKIKKVYERLAIGDLIDPTHYEIYLLLYVATRQAVNHIEYWSSRFTSEKGFKPLQLRVIQLIEEESAVRSTGSSIAQLINNDRYYDHMFFDEHLKVGGTTDVKWGFANCALPLVLSHNTPNNSVYVLWGPETSEKFKGLFPRMSRHQGL